MLHACHLQSSKILPFTMIPSRIYVHRQLSNRQLMFLEFRLASHIVLVHHPENISINGNKVNSGAPSCLQWKMNHLQPGLSGDHLESYKLEMSM